MYRVNHSYLDRDGHDQLDEIGALEASCPTEAVRSVVGRYRAADDLAAMPDAWPPDSGQLVVEPLSGAPDDAADVAMYKYTWYADDEAVCVWPVDD